MEDRNQVLAAGTATSARASRLPREAPGALPRRLSALQNWTVPRGVATILTRAEQAIRGRAWPSRARHTGCSYRPACNASNELARHRPWRSPWCSSSPLPQPRSALLAPLAASPAPGSAAAMPGVAHVQALALGRARARRPAHAGDRPGRGLPARGRRPAALVLTRIEPFAADARVEVMEAAGPRRLALPNNVYFAGALRGEPTSRVVLVATPETVDGFVTLGDDDLRLRPRRRRRAPCLRAPRRRQRGVSGAGELLRERSPSGALPGGSAAPPPTPSCPADGRSAGPEGGGHRHRDRPRAPLRSSRATRPRSTTWPGSPPPRTRSTSATSPYASASRTSGSGGPRRPIRGRRPARPARSTRSAPTG